MIIQFGMGIGYLLGVDDWGIELAWGMPRKAGYRYGHYVLVVFPWWVRPSKIRQRFEIAHLRRRQRRYEKRQARS